MPKIDSGSISPRNLQKLPMDLPLLKYISPYPMFGFYMLFCDDGNQDLLNDFLTNVLPETPESVFQMERKRWIKEIHTRFLQMPAFKKQEHELETHFDKW
jgi:hypothetical protein